MSFLSLNRAMCHSPAAHVSAIQIARLLIYSGGPVLRRVETILGLKYPYGDRQNFLKQFDGKTIAIVGNGRNIQGKGKEIDAHDIVIRMNFGALPKHLDEDDTGIKTNVISSGAMQVILSKDLIETVRDSATSILFCISGPGQKERPSQVFNRFAIRYRFMSEEERVAILHHDFFDELERGLDGHPPSTGYSTIMFLLQFATFRALSIYGFQFSSNNRIVGNMGKVSHNFNLEREQLLGRIQDRKDIQFIHK